MSQTVAQTKTMRTTGDSTIDVDDGQLNIIDKDTAEILNSMLVELMAIRTILSIAFNQDIRCTDNLTKIG